jgi:hypothetical protein
MSDTAKPSDPILDELHAIREQMLAECGGDLESLVKRLNRIESEVHRGAVAPATYPGSSIGPSTGAPTT